jgi:hypothetical protein
VLETSFKSLWVEIVSFLPQVLLALVIIIVGWVIGGVLKHVVERVFTMLKINDLLASAGVQRLTARTGYELRAGVFVGTLVKWFVIIVFFVAALDILNLDQVTVFFRDVVLGYLPQVIVAVLILFGAMILANVVDRSVVAAARTANFGSPEFLGNFARYSIIVFAVLAALAQLEIAPRLVEMLFAGFVFSTSLALGLSFGLGGKEQASRYIETVVRRNSN